MQEGAQAGGQEAAREAVAAAGSGSADHAARRRLPPGSHGIPADVVARNQRERLVAAMAEVCAERGYADASVTEVVKRAGVSSVTFYEQFPDKQACMLAAHRQLLGRLLETVDRAVESEPEPGGRVSVTLRTLLALFAADPPAARLLTVEILALGPAGAERHEVAVEGLASRLWLSGDRPPPEVRWALVAGILALIGRRVMTGEAESLPALEDRLAPLVALGGNLS